jgi:hypothetical protein
MSLADLRYFVIFGPKKNNYEEYIYCLGPSAIYFL